MFRLTSTRFVQELHRRRAAIAGQNVAVCLKAQPEIGWWYFQEFGTATHAENSSPHAQGYPIYPVNGSYLAWGEGENRVYTPHVGPPFTRLHPGVEPTGMIRRVLGDILQYAGATVGKALLASNYSPDAMRAALIEDVMPYAKETMVESVAVSLPGTRADGKLTGESASAAFEQGTYIEVSE